MNKEQIIRELSVLKPQEKKNYIIVGSAALTLCGINADSKDVDLQAKTEKIFRKSCIERQIELTELKVLKFSDMVDVGFNQAFDDVIRIWSKDKFFGILTTPEGYQYLNVFACLRWYKMASQRFNRLKDHERLALVTEVWEKHLADLKKKRLEEL